MTKYLLTADVFVGGAFRRKGEIIRYDGTPNKAMVELDASNKPVVKATATKATAKAKAETATDAPEVELKTATQAVSPGKAAAKAGG